MNSFIGLHTEDRCLVGVLTKAALQVSSRSRRKQSSAFNHPAGNDDDIQCHYLLPDPAGRLPQKHIGRHGSGSSDIAPGRCVGGSQRFSAGTHRFAGDPSEIPSTGDLLEQYVVRSSSREVNPTPAQMDLSMTGRSRWTMGGRRLREPVPEDCSGQYVYPSTQRLRRLEATPIKRAASARMYIPVPGRIWWCITDELKAAPDEIGRAHV